MKTEEERRGTLQTDMVEYIQILIPRDRKLVADHSATVIVAKRNINTEEELYMEYRADNTFLLIQNELNFQSKTRTKWLVYC